MQHGTFLSGLDTHAFDAMWLYMMALNTSLQQEPALLNDLSNLTYSNDSIASRIFGNVKELSIFGASVSIRYFGCLTQ